MTLHQLIPTEVTIDELAIAIDFCQANRENPVLKALVRPLFEIAVGRMTSDERWALTERATEAMEEILSQPNQPTTEP